MARSDWTTFDRQAPPLLRVVALAALVLCLAIAGVTFLNESATLPSRTGTWSVYGVRAKWASLIYVCVGLLLSSFVFSKYIRLFLLTVAFVLLLVELVGPFVAS